MIYSWTPDEDVLSGIADETIRAELRSLMFEDFYEGLLPEQRSFAKLGHLISRLEQLQSEPKAMEWTSTSQMVDPTHWKREARKPGEEASSTLRCAPTIALYQHLLWLTDVFGKMPGLSIIIG